MNFSQVESYSINLLVIGFGLYVFKRVCLLRNK